MVPAFAGFRVFVVGEGIRKGRKGSEIAAVGNAHHGGLSGVAIIKPYVVWQTIISC